MNQFISLQQAVDMTSLYRQQKENILAVPYQGQDILARSETFERKVFDTLLAKPGCAKLRIYYGMDLELKVHAILVPVNENNEDILPPAALSMSIEEEDDDEGDIGEKGVRCPIVCPPPSPLDPP